MRIGVPRETKADENRVAITPAGVSSFARSGHEVYIEKSAGSGSGIADEEYRSAGAKILDKAADVFAIAEMVLKVKEPLPPEYDLLTDGKVLFTYLHLAPEPELTRVLLRNRVTAIAYETVQKEDGSLPLLTPMSEVAGKMATQIGAHLLEKRNGGRGILLGGVAGVPQASVAVVGGGTVGTSAAKVAVGMGAHVTIMDLNINRLRYLDDIFGGRVATVVSNPFNIAEAVKAADLVVGAVLVPGARAPKLVSEEMVKAMRAGSVIVDVAIDQGGSIETIDRVTTHSNPTYMKHGVVHYSVANMPGAVPRTSTFALTNATLPYALKLANKGYLAAMKEDRSLALGLNTICGSLTYKAVADAHGIQYAPASEFIR